MVLWKLSVV